MGGGGCTLHVSTRTMLKQRANSKETSQGKSDDVTDAGNTAFGVEAKIGFFPFH